MSIKIETTTAREKELAAMIFEKNTLIEQLAAEKQQLRTEVQRLRSQLEPEKKEA